MNGLAVHALLGRCLMAPDAALRRRLTNPGFPWSRLIEAANRSYLTPALAASLRDTMPEGAPAAEAARYLAHISGLNAQRNERLRTQLHELVSALNAHGIVPVLLKGAAGLFASVPDAYAASRMVTDLDLLIEAERASDALTVLAELGYSPREGRAPARHALGDFVRARDVGTVDLHMRLVNEPHLLPVEDMLRRTVGHEADGLRSRILSPTDRVLHLLLHDLVQDRGIHDGRLNFRHLHEIAVLLASGAPLRWDAIMARLARHRLGHLAEVALLAARFFFATPIPAGVRPSARARLHLWRALLQLRHPWLARCGEVFGNVHYCLAWYRHEAGYKRLPRLRRSLDYLRAHRLRTAGRVLHILFAHRT